RDRFNHLAECEVVVGDLRLWRGAAPGMVVRQVKKVESGPTPVGLSRIELPYKAIRPYHIRDLQVPPWHIRRAVRPQGSDTDILNVMDRVGMIGEVGIDLEPACGRRRLGIIHLAVIAEGQAML